MHPLLRLISENILNNALGALMQANTHSTFFDPGNEHWENMSVLNAAQAGELLFKAIIAQKDPLLIFQNASDLRAKLGNSSDLEADLSTARTHSFSRLPHILKAECGQDLPHLESFNEILEVRNAIQHFFHPAGNLGIGQNAKDLSLMFLYSNVDPLLKKHFGLYAIEFHEDRSVGYDYLVGCLLRHELQFSIPHDFEIHEISVCEELEGASATYRSWFRNELQHIAKEHLLDQ